MCEEFVWKCANKNDFLPTYCCKICGAPYGIHSKFVVYGNPTVLELLDLIKLQKYQRGYLEKFNNNSRIIQKPINMEIRGFNIDIIIIDDPLDDE